MRILTNIELRKRINDGKDSLIYNVKNNFDSEDTPFQPTSLDLTVGELYLPDEQNISREEVVLEQGQTVYIISDEQLNFPDNIMGIGFPPSRNFINGLLMTNPGHVDPGSKNKLHFTIIYMGKRSITLRKGDKIFTLLIFELSETPDISDKKKIPNEGYNVIRILDNLSNDFLDIKNRALKIAKNEITKAEFRVRFWQVIVPLIAAIIAGLISIYSSNQKFQKEINTINSKINGIDQKIEYRELDTRVKKLESDLGIKNDTI